MKTIVVCVTVDSMASVRCDFESRPKPDFTVAILPYDSDTIDFTLTKIKA